MPRRLPGLVRGLTSESLASVAYGEVGSSIYFALGIVALYALGLTPWVLLAVGLLFLLVALSYAEGTAALPETGGAAMLARRAFNDPTGFLTGWVLLLDYAIVIALASLFIPHYFGHAVGWIRITHHPWDVVAAVFVILAITVLRLIRRPGLYRLAIVMAVVAFVSTMILIVLGFVFLFSPSDLESGAHPGIAPTWHALAFSLPVAMLAYTGLETVANLAQEAREPGKTLPRSLFVGLGAAIIVSVLMGIVGIAAFPGVGTRLGTDFIHAPLLGIVSAFQGHMPAFFVDALRMLDRLDRRDDPARRRDHLDLRDRAGRLLARPLPDAPARLRDVRPAEHAAARRRSSAPRPSRARWSSSRPRSETRFASSPASTASAC